MSEQIYSQFHKNKIPATWLSPTVTVRYSDWTIVVNNVSMVEVWNWRYKYDDNSYDKGKLNLVDVNWNDTALDDQYQSVVNELDAYQNKWDWKSLFAWTGGWKDVDTKKLAQDIWSVKTKDLENKNGTVWQHLVNLDTDTIIEKVDSLEIPDNSKELWEISQKSDNILEWQKEIKWSIKKTDETVGQLRQETAHSIDILQDQTNTQWKEISLEFDKISKELSLLENIDYRRIEKYFLDNSQSNIPLMLQIEDLKQEIKNDIKWGNSDAMKEYILKSIENQQLYEKQLADTKLQTEFKESVDLINNSLSELSKKEVDFSPIKKEFEDISNDIKESIKSSVDCDEDVKAKLEDQYQKSMKYIIYIAKHMWGISSKQDILEIKKYLSGIKN